ncbi:MAG: DUF883 family protein [Paucibacter sp.]|nr:DUF883 family protein [Roseateles sp.]
MTQLADDRLVGELHEVVGEAEALLKATAGATGAGSRELRAKVQASLDQARARLHQLQDKARAAGKATDEYVHTNPWQAIGFAAAAGLVVGLLIGRRR